MKKIYKAAWLHIQDRSLLFTRSKNKHSFFLPGGKPEAGELMRDALIREVKEECSVDILPETIREYRVTTGHATGLPDDVFVECHMFFADFSGTLLKNSEIEELTFLRSPDANRTSTVGIDALHALHADGLID